MWSSPSDQLRPDPMKERGEGGARRGIGGRGRSREGFQNKKQKKMG